MNRRLFLIAQVVLIALVGGITVAGADPQRPQFLPGKPPIAKPSNESGAIPLTSVGSGFTYQGSLKDGSNPANGQYDFTFALFDAAAPPSQQIGSTITMTNQAVSNGLFTVMLDFGAGAFQGDARWLQIAVRQSGGGSYTTLSPRQVLTPAPYAESLMPGSVISATTSGSVLSINDIGPGVALAVTSTNGYGLQSYSANSNAIYAANSNSGSTVLGNNGADGEGVTGLSVNGAGVGGTSTNSNGVLGVTFNTFAAVRGINYSSGPGVSGESTNSNAIVGTSNNSFATIFGSNSSSGPGVQTSSASGRAVQADGGTYGVYATGSSTDGVGVYGQANTGTSSKGLLGSSTNGYGVYGITSAASGFGAGVYGSNNGSGPGVFGITSATNGRGVYGEANIGSQAAGVYGNSTSGNGVVGTSSASYGIFGQSTFTNSIGVFGRDDNGTNASGVYGSSTSGYGLYGTSGTGTGVYGNSTNSYGVYGASSNSTGLAGVSTNGYGVYGESDNSGYITYGALATSTQLGVYGTTNRLDHNYAGYFFGNVHITGSCCAMGEGTTQIDDPLDPANKVLNQSVVASPDMLEVYRGHVTLDANGSATVQLPPYFQDLNRDFDYQLTPVGAPMPNLYVAKEVQGNSFKIAGGKPGSKVSWQVTGVRQDPYAAAHPIQVEQDKPAEQRGLYLYPQEVSQRENKGIDYQQQQKMQLTVDLLTPTTELPHSH